MKQEEFTGAFSQEFAGFTSRMYVDYLDEHKNPFAKTEDYAGYVLNNFKYLVKKFNSDKIK